MVLPVTESMIETFILSNFLEMKGYYLQEFLSQQMNLSPAISFQKPGDKNHCQ